MLLWANDFWCAPSCLPRGRACQICAPVQKPTPVFLHASPRRWQGSGDGPTSHAQRDVPCWKPWLLRWPGLDIQIRARLVWFVGKALLPQLGNDLSCSDHWRGEHWPLGQEKNLRFHASRLLIWQLSWELNSLTAISIQMYVWYNHPAWESQRSKVFNSEKYLE